MKYIIRIIIAFFCFVTGLIACGICKDKLLSYQLTFPTTEELSYKDSLKVKVLQTGDTIAYNNLKAIMREEGFPHKIWFYSIVMAKQYHYIPASYDVCRNINYVYDQRTRESEKKIDLKTRKLLSLFEAITEADLISECNK